MYKSLTRFTASDSPMARRSLARVIIITHLAVRSGKKKGNRGCLKEGSEGYQIGPK